MVHHPSAAGSGTTTPVAALLAGGTYRDVAGFTDDEIEALYTAAYNKYEGGEFEEAEQFFRILCLLDHRAERFWMGLGAARQKLKDYGGAIMAYSMVAENGYPNPYAALHAAECYIALGLLEEAISGIDSAVDWCGYHRDPQVVLQHAETLSDLIERMIAPGADDGAATRAAS